MAVILMLQITTTQMLFLLVIQVLGIYLQQDLVYKVTTTMQQHIKLVMLLELVVILIYVLQTQQATDHQMLRIGIS